jgi:hypothetical protein
MGTWIKFPCAYWSDPRLLQLKRNLRDAALTLPARLWTFAAVSAEDGKLAAYSPEDLARLLEYPGDGEGMIRAFQEAKYLDRKCRIVGWADIYGLPASRQRAARKGAAGRWGARPSPAPSVQGEKQKEEKEKIEEREEREAHALRDGMRDASEHTHSPNWPSLIPLKDADAIAIEHQMTLEGVQLSYREFRQHKVTFADPVPSDPSDILEAFRGWLGSSKDGKAVRAQYRRGVAQSADAEDNVPPPDRWKEAALSDDSTSIFAKGSWAGVPVGFYRSRIRALAALLNGGQTDLTAP